MGFIPGSAVFVDFVDLSTGFSSYSLPLRGNKGIPQAGRDREAVRTKQDYWSVGVWQVAWSAKVFDDVEAGLSGVDQGTDQLLRESGMQYAVEKSAQDDGKGSN